MKFNPGFRQIEVRMTEQGRIVAGKVINGKPSQVGSDITEQACAAVAIRAMMQENNTLVVTRNGKPSMRIVVENLEPELSDFQPQLLQD